MFSKLCRYHGIQLLILSGPASSAEERTLRKIVYSGDPSLNTASSSKKTLRVVHAQNYLALGVTPILQKNFTGILNLKATSIGDEL